MIKYLLRLFGFLNPKPTETPVVVSKTPAQTPTVDSVVAELTSLPRSKNETPDELPKRARKPRKTSKKAK
jgi:hypothetical protein